MITRDQITAAVRANDEYVRDSNNDLDGYLRQCGVDPEAVAYVAQQRAVRAAYAQDGGDPRTLPAWERVPLSDEAKALLPWLSVTWLDGFAACLEVFRGPQREPIVTDIREDQ